MILPREFFHLQLRFAENVARVCQLSLDDALIEYSTLYMSFELGRAFDPAHPVWRQYLAGLHTTDDAVEWTYAFYRQRRTEYEANYFGCFYYAYIQETRVVRPHFANRETLGYSALSKERMTLRLRELAAMFADVRIRHPEAERVRGSSWLHNIEAYRRLFPREYTENAEVADDEFPFLALWGQFLTRDEQLREKMAGDFLSRVAEQSTLEAIKRCFPYLPLRPTCSIDHFYRFYGLL